jgi:predicted phage tail protein
MRTIYLYGELSDLFIDKIELEVQSIGEAIKALSTNFPTFASYMLEHKPGFHVKTGDIFRDTETLLEPLGSKDIHLIPVVSGSGKVGLIVAGAFLIYMTAGAAAGAVGAGFGGTTAGASALGASGMVSAGVATTIGNIGVGLVMSGISAVLFAPPKPQPTTPTENTPNTYFNGVVNTVSQGLPVPIGYGELIIGSAVISAAISIDSTAGIPAYDWLVPESGYIGWTLQSGTTYKKDNLNLYYNTATNIYTWTTSVSISNAEGSFYFDESGNYIEASNTTYTVSYTYYKYTSRFKISGLPDPSVAAISKYEEYLSPIGSSKIPEGWGT